MFKYHNGLPAMFTVLCMLTYFTLVCSGYHITDSEVSTNRTRRQTMPCGSYTFKCDNGNCISRDKLCDGRVDCPDRSDENAKCLERRAACPEYAFKCAYGACVDGDAKCNNVQNCADNSDEIGCVDNRFNTCGSKFSCKNGQCINRYLLCDGRKDCTDGTDENFENCNGIACQEFSYRCAYGACVDGDAQCNGVVDCADGSDESEQICGPSSTTTPPTTTTSTTTAASVPKIDECTLPPQPTNGRYVLKGSYITFICDSNHNLYPAKYNVAFCHEGQWYPGIPKCAKTCKPRISDSVETVCELDGIKEDCSKPMIEGTIVKMSCKHLYKQIDGASNPVSICKDGSWDYGFIKCVPECGQLVPEGDLFIVGGQSAKHGAFPWHVGIYRLKKDKYEQSCGGSIVTPKLVVSAAHCFTAYSNGAKHDVKSYAIGAGKYYRDYYNETETWAQIRKVKDIIIPHRYKGVLSSFGGDIAFLLLDEPLLITHVVQPVCIDWNSEHESAQLRSNSKGQVVGWGFTEEDKPSPELKQLEVPYIDLENCNNVVPQSFIRFLTLDKFCAGYTTGLSVCNGDSGGGLVFYRKEDKKYYLRGLVSAGPTRKGLCDPMHYGTYTKVSTYMEELRRVEISSRL